MKRNYLYALFLLPALFLLSGCEAEIDKIELSDPSVFTATIDGSEPATKTLLGALSGDKRQVHWSADDSLRIGGARYDVSQVSATDPQTATFTGNGAQLDGGVYKAYYPASIYNGGTPTLPATQTYSTMRIDNLPMYAQSAATNLEFKNLCAVLELKLTGTETVGSIVVESTEGKKLSGPFTVKEASPAGSEKWYAEIDASASGASNTVTLSCETSGVALNATTPTSFFIAVPAQEYTLGTLKVTVKKTAAAGGDEITSFTNSNGALNAVRSNIYEVAKEAIQYTYVFNVTNPTDLSYLGGTSTSGSVVSYKHPQSDPTDKRAVAWTIQGYYSNEASARYKNGPMEISETILTAVTPTSQIGSGTGEGVDIAYSSSDPVSGASTSLATLIKQRLQSNSGAYAKRGSAETPWNLANPSTGGKTAIVNTANTYIVNAPGYYCIPLVMGNGIKNGALNTTAYMQTNFTDYKGTALNNANSTPFLRPGGNGSSMGTPTAAHVVYEVRAKMVEVVDETSWALPSGCITFSDVNINGVSQGVYWLNFHIMEDKIDQGCMLLAVTDENNEIMWSWTIWVTDYVPHNYPGYDASSSLADIECTYNQGGSKVTFMPRNLGWYETGSATGVNYPAASVYIRLEQPESGNYVVMEVTRPRHFQESRCTSGYGGGPFYQWGRKDPLMAGETTYGKSTYEYTTSESATLATSIKNPNKYYTNYYGGTAWIVNFSLNLWCAGNTQYNTDKPTIKTIYDPCPAGYAMPRYSAYDGFKLGSAPNIESWANADGSFQRGFWFWSGYRANSSVSTNGMKTIFFPAAGEIQSLGGNPANVGVWGAYPTAVPSTHGVPETQARGVYKQFWFNGGNRYVALPQDADGTATTISNGNSIRPARE